MEIIGLISALLPVLLVVLNYFIDSKKKQEANQNVTNIQTERQALADNDGSTLDAVGADQHDRVRQALGGG